MSLKLWQQVNLTLLLPILVASAIVLYAVYTLGSISKRIGFIEIADDINLTLLELRRYEKNIMLFNEEQNVKKFNEHLARLDSQVQAAEKQIVEEMQKLRYKPLMEDIRKYRNAVRGLIEATRDEHRLLEEIRPVGRTIEQKARRKELALELRRFEKNYIIYREGSAVDKVYKLSDQMVDMQPDLILPVTQYRRVFDGLIQIEDSKERLVQTMRQSGRAIESVTMDFSGRKRDAIDRTIIGSRRLLIGSLVVLLISTTAVACYFSTNVVKTLKTMEKSFTRLTKGDFSYGMDVQSASAPAEILSFIDAYNRTIDRLAESRAELDFTLLEVEAANRELMERQDELVEARKLTAMRLLASEIAHEINNPLSSLSMFLGVCHEELAADDPKKEMIALMLKEVSRCKSVLHELVDFARKEPLKVKEVNPVSILKDAVKVVRRQHEDSRVHLDVFCSELPQKVLLDPVLVHQALVNILNNAYQFTEPGGSIEVEGYVDCRDMVIEIKDSGSGIPEDHLPYIFEPFFSTRKELGGSGLGLAITKKIIDRHHGMVRVDSRPGEGTVFTIRLAIEEA